VDGIVVLYCGSHHIKGLLDKILNYETDVVVMKSNTSVNIISALEPKGIIITGSPESVLSKNSPKVDPAIYELGIPVLGICYGCQRMVVDLGGTVVRKPSPEKDNVLMAVFEEEPSLLFKGFTLDGVDVWMNHHLQPDILPEGFRHTGQTKETTYAAFERGHLYCVQFHPDKDGSGSGTQILNNFLDICFEA
jgi:GMP synthase (glutamine-hydrolysing)